MRACFSILVALVLTSVHGSECGSPMELMYLNSSKCQDGSSAGYFINGPSTATKFLIWFGDSDLCENESECQSYCDGQISESTCTGLDATGLNASTVNCYFNELHCGSSQWSKLDSTPLTVMCGDDAAVFKDYVRVFVPQCTFDWFLGNSPSGLFSGSNVVTELINVLVATYGMDSASSVVLGGTRGGGVAAMNLIPFIRTLLVAKNAAFTGVMRAIPDSAFFMNIRNFGVTDYSNSAAAFLWDETLRTNTANWIADSAIDPKCKTYSTTRESDLHRCLYPEYLLEKGSLLQEKVFVLQSQYDLIFLREFGLADDGNRDAYPDDEAYQLAAIQYVEGLGSIFRQSFRDLLDRDIGDNLLVFGPACGQHGFILPTNFHRVKTTEEGLGDAGGIMYERMGTEWETVVVMSTNIKTQMTKWINDESVVDSIDIIAEFLSNPTCPSEIKEFVLSPQTSDCSQGMIVLYTLSFIASMWIGFILTYIRVMWFDAKCKRYWKKNASDNKDGGKSSKQVQRAILKEAAAQNHNRTIQLMVQDLSYWAPSKKRGETPYKILHNVNLNFKAGSVHAMMGPSGSGKSTLLDVVSYTRQNGKMSGTHYINGVASHLNSAGFLREWLRNSVSYVRQTDVLFPKLTVREHLQHAAWLMLPEYMSDETKLRRVWQVIKLLELESCADTICGDGGVLVEGGISGGQRRRVSVATQLLKMPAALLLDEPTSGLDSTNALLLVKCLNNLAHKANISVILTIHQPRREIFRLLDYMTILVKGSVVFSGPPDKAAAHFGVDKNEVNVGDQILDVIQESTESKLQSFTDAYINGPLGKEVLSSMEKEKTSLTSESARALKAVLVENALGEGRWSWTEATSTMTTLWVLMSRTIKRGGFDILRTVPFALVGGVLVGLVFLGSDTYTGHTALCYLAVTAMTFLQGTFLGDRYMLEKQMWSHEKDNGTNISWVAFLVCLFLRNIVSSTLEGLAYALPVYFMGNLNFSSFEVFANYCVLMVLVAVAVTVQNTTVEIDRIRRGGEGSDDSRQAILINMSLLSLGTIFNGFIIQLKDIPVFLQWFPYIMLSYWGFVGALVNNFTSFRFPCDDCSAIENAQRSGDNYVKQFQYDDRDVYQCIFALLVLVFVLHLLSVVDYYLRFVYSSGDQLKRVKDEHDDAFTKKTKLAITGDTMHRIINKDAKTDDDEGFGSRGAILSVLLSRQTLTLFFLIDCMSMWLGCILADDESISTFENATAVVDNVRNAADAFLAGNGTSVALMVFNLGIVSVYLLQFIIQLMFLVPLSADGTRKSFVWISWHDLIILLLLALDVSMVVLLLVVAQADILLQIIFLVLIHLVRVGHIMMYSMKVNYFHSTRSKGLVQEEPAAFDNDDGKSSRSGSTASRSVTSFAMRSSGAQRMVGFRPPPVPPSRNAVSARYRQMDLGPAWRAYQDEFPQGNTDDNV